MVFSRDGQTLYYAAGEDRCAVNAVDVETRTVSGVRELSYCPERLTVVGDELLASSPTSSAWIAADGSTRFEGRTILAALDAAHLLERTPEGLVWLNGEVTLTLDVTSLRDPRFTTDGLLLAVEPHPDGERIVRFDGASPTAITPIFSAIDSWDVAPRGLEVVFSADVGSGFDVGIVSASGGEINWVAPEPVDERNVTWAPRGNKITYTFESADATLVRSVHIPTSFQVLFDLPLTTVRQVGWEPQAVRFAMVTETPGSGARIDWIGYQGENRATLVDGADRVETPIEVLFWERGSGVLLGPETVRYDRTRAIVVWVEADDPFAYRPEVARLRNEGVPVLVTIPDRLGRLQDALAGLAWVSSSRLYVVDVTGLAGPAAAEMEGATWMAMMDGDAPEGAEIIRGDVAAFRAAAVRRILEREKAAR